MIRKVLGSGFCDTDAAEDTCPIAVGCYAELHGLSDTEIKQFLTAETQQREIDGNYTGRIIPNQPVMYLRLPDSPLSQHKWLKDRKGRTLSLEDITH